MTKWYPGWMAALRAWADIDKVSPMPDVDVFHDEPAAQANLWRSFESMWLPEVERRRAAGSLPDGFVIRQCLVKLPQGAPPIVLFNDEVGWKVKIDHVHAENVRVGDPIMIHQIRRLVDIDLPSVDDRRVAFIYLHYTGIPLQYRIICDFYPNHPEFDSTRDMSVLKSQLLSCISDMFEERIVRRHDSYLEKLHAAGLWAAPALMPYPFSRMIELVNVGDVETAHQMLVEASPHASVASWTEQWWLIPEFERRRRVLERAIAAYTAGQFELVVHTLMPMTEGIVTDWMYRVLASSDDVPYRVESKLRKFRDVVLQSGSLPYSDRRVAEATIDFIVSGPVLQSFPNWNVAPSSAFPNRHAVQHGRHDDSHYSNVACLKLILLLDTIARIMQGSEEGT